MKSQRTDPGWIAALTDYDDDTRRERAVLAVARTIYPSPFGQDILDGLPRTALSYSTRAVEALERLRLC